MTFSLPIRIPETDADRLRAECLRLADSHDELVRERNQLVETLKGVWDLAHVVVLNTEDAQARHQEIADVAERALVRAGVLTPSDPSSRIEAP